MNTNPQEEFVQALKNGAEKLMQLKNMQEEPTNEDIHKNFQLNLDPEYWKYKFLYPFALDPAPRLSGTQTSPSAVFAEKKRLKLLAEEGLMTTTKF